MKNNLRPVLLLVFTAVIFFAAGTHFVFAQDVPQIKLWAKSDRMIYHKGEEITLFAYLKNNGEEKIELNEPAIARQSYYIEILQPDGKKEKLLSVEGLRLQKITLEQNKVLKFTVKFVSQMCGEHQINIIYYGFLDEPLSANPVRVFVVQ